MTEPRQGTETSHVCPFATPATWTRSFPPLNTHAWRHICLLSANLLVRGFASSLPGDVERGVSPELPQRCGWNLDYGAYDTCSININHECFRPRMARTGRSFPWDVPSVLSRRRILWQSALSYRPGLWAFLLWSVPKCADPMEALCPAALGRPGSLFRGRDLQRNLLGGFGSSSAPRHRTEAPTHRENRRTLAE